MISEVDKSLIIPRMETIKNTAKLSNLSVYKDNKILDKETKIPRMESIRRTADILGLPVHFVRAKVLSGEVVAVRAGRRFLVNVDKLVEYLNTNVLTPATDTTEATKGGRVSPIELRR